MNERKFRPEVPLLVALAVAVLIAFWFARSRSPAALPAGTGPGIQVTFASASSGSSAGPGPGEPAVIGVDGATPPSLPAAAVRGVVGKLDLGTPVLEIPDSDTPAAARDAVRGAGGQPGSARILSAPVLVLITARSGEAAAAYAGRFTVLDAAVKGADPGVAVGGGMGEYDGSFLRTFLEDGGSRADFVDFSFYGESGSGGSSGAGEQRLLGELTTVSAEIGDARSVVASARAGDIGIYVGPWNITSVPSSTRFTAFAAMWDADLLGRILAGGAGGLADGAGLLYDGDGTASRAYQAGSPAPLYAAIGMFTGSGLFPRFGTPVPSASVSSGIPGVDVFASASPDEVVVVNTSSSTHATVLHVGGDSPVRAAQWRLGQSDGAVSGPVSAGTATSRNGSIALSLPSGSVTTVVVTPDGTGGAGANTVTVANASTGQCLATGGSSSSSTVATAPCDGAARQHWRLSGTALVEEDGGRCLAGDASGRVSAQPCDGGLAQDWYNLGSRLVSAQTGRCLNGNGTAEVYALTCDDASQQSWALTP
jgi:hypothetical protein